MVIEKVKLNHLFFAKLEKQIIFTKNAYIKNFVNIPD